MKIETIGCLRVQALWEQLLNSLPQNAEGPEGLGKIWEHEDAPRNPGQDPILKQGWRLEVIRNVEFQVPTGAEVIEVAAENSPTGKKYTLIRTDKSAVHVHEGAAWRHGHRAVIGNAHVCARVIWPKGAEERNDGAIAWRNYLLYVDITSANLPGNPSYELVVFPEGAERFPVLMLGVDDVEEGTDEPVRCWATRSANWKPAQEQQPSTGSDQLIAFYKTM